MQLEKPKLFPTKKGFFLTLAVLFVSLLIRLVIEYYAYVEFITKPFYYTQATVLTSYEKTNNDRRYTVLKLKSDEGFTFYTTTHQKDNFASTRLRLQIFPSKEIGFKDYLGTFYVKSKIKHQEKLAFSYKDKLLKHVASQHEDTRLQTFYNAIFFATPIDKKLRETISMLGVSHLVALSGFHLGILWGLIYGLLYLLYRPFQQAYFPYRHALFDVGVVAIVALGLYVWFVGFPPSLVRSYAMVFMGWVVVLLGMELVSFTFLTTIVFILSSLLPSLLVSIGFWLSVAGVFYIFLLLQYTKGWSVWGISLLVIPLGIFILMLPIVHSIFGVTNGYQLLSPLLSILFIPFYPMEMFLHLVGYGDVLDSMLEGLFLLPMQSSDNILPLGMMLGYLFLSLMAIWNKKFFTMTLSVSTLYMIYLFISV